MTKKQFDELPVQQIQLKEVPSGCYFMLTQPKDEQQGEQPERLVWVRGDYCREDKKYYCYKYEDINHERAMKGTKLVWVGFTF